MYYCECCGKMVPTEVVKKREVFHVFHDEIEVVSNVRVCGNCKEEIYDEKLDSETQEEVFRIYRGKHKLLSKNEIIQIRKQYGLSQRNFAKLLNWGDKTVRRYEQGSLPDRTHNSLLHFLKVPENMESYLEENETMIDEKIKQKILDRIAEDNSGTLRSVSMVIDHYIRPECSIETGYMPFDFEKISAMVQYFASQSREMLKVKLMKLLHYADMQFFKENGTSISGSRYVHYPYGPVPYNYDLLLGLMNAEGEIKTEIRNDGNYEKHVIVAIVKNWDDVLAANEIDMLRRVYDFFRDYTSSQIAEYSHHEEGYRETAQGEVISYLYADKLRDIPA